ncbi:MAG: hypothetical protein ACRD43_02685, partial [Pyrinomonadaceae bacterium]
VTTIGNFFPGLANYLFKTLFACWLLAAAFSVVCLGQVQLSTPDDKTLVIDDAPEMEVIAFGKSVVVKKRAKSVLSVGGDVLVEGAVEEDVVAFGGSITQKQEASIGGHIFVIGGAYRPESQNPLRGAGKETIMIAAFEDEIRDVAQNPTQIFAPTFSLLFLAQRLFSILFWFVVSFALTTLAPGAVSRGIARLQLRALEIAAIGCTLLVIISAIVLVSVKLLPQDLRVLSVLFGFVTFILFLLAYVFGRVVMQVSVGKMIQKRLLSERSQSETLAILFGVLAWTILLSIPYIWTLALIALFAGGIGLVITARSKNTWRRD